MVLFLSCSKVDIDKRYIPIIEDIPDMLNNFDNDYSINDFWEVQKDSTLFYLLEEFSLNSNQISMLKTGLGGVVKDLVDFKSDYNKTKSNLNLK